MNDGNVHSRQIFSSPQSRWIWFNPWRKYSTQKLQISANQWKSSANWSSILQQRFAYTLKNRQIALSHNMPHFSRTKRDGKKKYFKELLIGYVNIDFLLLKETGLV